MPTLSKNISIESVNHSHFDIAIIGAGCGGLTLAKQISVFTTGSIAIIDKNTQRPNHFWGFWDDGPVIRTPRSRSKTAIFDDEACRSIISVG